MVWAIWTVRYGADTKTKSASHFYEKSHPVAGIILTQKFLRENDLIQLKFMRNSPFSVRILGTFHH